MSEGDNSQEIYTDDLSVIRKELMSIEKEYYQTREMLFNTTRRYFNQSIASNYISEQSLLDLVFSCRNIKDKYMTTQKILKEKQHNPGWSFGDNFIFGKRYDNSMKEV